MVPACSVLASLFYSPVRLCLIEMDLQAAIMWNLLRTLFQVLFQSQ